MALNQFSLSLITYENITVRPSVYKSVTYNSAHMETTSADFLLSII